MKKLVIACMVVFALSGCDAIDVPSVEGVVSNVRFPVGQQINGCQVDFKDGRTVYFINGAGFVFKKNAVNRIHRYGTMMINSVEIIEPDPDK